MTSSQALTTQRGVTRYDSSVPVEWYGNGGQLTEEQKTVITAMAKGASKTQLAVFFNICERYRLDPFDASGQVWFVKRKVWNPDTRTSEETYSVQIGVAGLRLLAARTGDYQGEIGPEFSKDGSTWAPYWLWDKPPAVARVGVRRRGFSDVLWAYSTWQESAQLNKEGQPMSLWKTKPAFMLGKVAEAAALKRAFPAELGGLAVNTDIELDQSQYRVVEGDQVHEEHQQPRRELPQAPARVSDLYPDEPGDGAAEKEFWNTAAELKYANRRAVQSQFRQWFGENLAGPGGLAELKGWQKCLSLLLEHTPGTELYRLTHQEPDEGLVREEEAGEEEPPYGYDNAGQPIQQAPLMDTASGDPADSRRRR